MKAFDKGKEVAFWLQRAAEAASARRRREDLRQDRAARLRARRSHADFDAARSITEAVSEHLQRQHPKEITTEWATHRSAPARSSWTTI